MSIVVRSSVATRNGLVSTRLGSEVMSSRGLRVNSVVISNGFARSRRMTLSTYCSMNCSVSTATARPQGMHMTRERDRSPMATRWTVVRRQRPQCSSTSYRS